MNLSQLLLDQINFNNSKISRENVNKLLIIFQEEHRFFIGDTIMRFDRLKYLKSYYTQAQVDINFFHKEYLDEYNALIANNPNVDKTFGLSFDEIDFLSYDVIICLSYDEKGILAHLTDKYAENILTDKNPLSILSISAFFYEDPANFAFTPHYELKEYASHVEPGELYITSEEQQWAEAWLLSNGLKENESLFVILDDTIDRAKLLTEKVYFEFLNDILDRQNIKVLNRDEKNAGKEEHYRKWLAPEKLEKIIFSKDTLTLRQILCIIACRYTKFVFGPCTGIMHCSSSIYNNLVNKGLTISDVPLMITYTGKDFKKDLMAKYWWGTSPLVTCLVLARRNGQIKPIPLNELKDKERNRSCKIPANKYTCEMLTDFIAERQLLQFNS